MPVSLQDCMEQAFLEDILARPADDTPRLVFADWLTERDGPGDSLLAEFIRVQCQLPDVEARLPEEYWRAAGTELYAQRDRLLVRQLQLYNQEAQGQLLDHVNWCGWRRGFVECIALSSLDWCRHHQELRSLAPIQDVTLLDHLNVVYFTMQDQVYLHNFGVFKEAFATLSHAVWQTRPHDGNQPGLTAWWVPHVWPGITFHGPDFDEDAA